MARHKTSPEKSSPVDEELAGGVNLSIARCIVFVVGILCFANSIWAEFAFDDAEAVIRNVDVKGKTNFSELIRHDFWGHDITSNLSHKSYRPLTVLTLRWSFALAGGMHPMGFHIANIVLFGIVCVLQLQVFQCLLSSQQTSLLAGILFAVHPIHTESVAGVVGRADLLCAIFVLLAFLMYEKACRQDGLSLLLLLLSMASAVLSVLSKELGITVLGLCSVYDIIVVQKVTLPSLFSFLKQQSPERGRFIFRHVLLMATGVFILIGRWQVMGSEPPSFRPIDNPHSFVDGFFLRVINLSYIYSLNAWLLVNPWWLCFDWSMGCVPLIDSVSDPRVLGVLCLWTVIAALVYTCLKFLHYAETRQLTMAVAWLILPFLPATNIFFRVGFVIAERVLLLPSAGFVMIVSLGLGKILASKTLENVRRVVWFCFFILVTLHAARSVQRSSEWVSERVLFDAGLRVCPLNAKVHYNIARVASDLGDDDRALKEYRIAVRLFPEYDQALNNLGNLLKDLGQVQEAEELLIRATQARKEFAAAHMNLAIIQVVQKKYSAAEKNYLLAIKYRPKYPDCFYNLGNLYQDTGRREEALTAWWNATRQNYTHVMAWNNIIAMLDNMERFKDIDMVMKEATHYCPNSAMLYYTYANALGKAGPSRYGDSEKAFFKALKLAPNNANFYANLAVLYHLWKKYELADANYKKALSIEPTHQYALDNYALLQHQWIRK